MMVLIFFLHGVIVRSCYTSYMKRYLQFSIVVNTFISPSCLKISDWWLLPSKEMIKMFYLLERDVSLILHFHW